MTSGKRSRRDELQQDAVADTVFDDAEVFDSFVDEEAAAAARARTIARLRLLWNRRRLLIRATAWGMAAALALAFLLPRRYESTARLMPPESQSASGTAILAALSGSSGLGAMAGNLLGLKGTGALFVGILGSRTIQDRLVDQFDLMEVYGASRREDARKELASRTSLSEDRKSGIVTITVEDRDPARAAALAGAYVRELDRLVVELTTSAAHRERMFLEDRLRAVKEDLDAAAKEFSEFASKNTTLDIREQGRAMVDAAASLQGQLIAAQTELEGLRQVYTDNNVRVRAVRARITELRRQIEKMGGDPRAAGAGEKSLGSPYPTLRELPLLGVTYADLYRRTKIQETVYELLTQQYELAKVQEAKEIPSVKVLDEPVVPEKKSFPPRLLILLAGTLLAFLGSAAWVLGSARWQETDPADPGRQLAEEIFTVLQARASRLTGNGLRVRMWSRLRRNGHGPEQHPADGAPASGDAQPAAEEAHPEEVKK